MKTKKKGIPDEEQIYTQFDYEKHPSFFDRFKKKVVKKITKTVDDFKRGQKLSQIKKQRKPLNKGNPKNPKGSK